ncbi:MAG: ABC transporter substrate-binding protein [Bacillota bacterium]
MFKRKPVLSLLATLAAMLILSGCGGGAQPAPRESTQTAAAASTGPWEFTDDRGTKVSRPQRPVRVVAQSNAAAALWDLGFQVIGVFGPQRQANGSNDPEIGNVDLSKVTSVGEQWGELDLEKLASLRPDLIVTTMWQPPDLWYIKPDVADKVAAIAPIVAINVAQRPINEPMARFEELAKALGADLNAPEVAAARKRFEKASADLKAAVAEKPGLKVLFAAGSLETFWVANPPYYADLLYFKQLGLEIVVPEKPQQFVESLSWEQAQRYPADLIMYDVRAHVTPPAQLAEKVPTWKLHPAVKAEQVGAWHATASYSYKGFAAILEDLAKTVRNSRPDIVQ